MTSRNAPLTIINLSAAPSWCAGHGTIEICAIQVSIKCTSSIVDRYTAPDHGDGVICH